MLQTLCKILFFQQQPILTCYQYNEFKQCPISLNNQYQRMSIYLFPTKNFSSHNYSTNLMETNKIDSRVFQSYRQQCGGSSSKTKAYNMNDDQKRLRRDHGSLYKESKQQSQLFEKGVKKITPSLKQQPVENSIKRQYRNKETYNVIEPTPIIETKFNQGGVRKIYLYDQRKQSNSLRGGSESRKKILRDFNKQSQQKNDSGVYFVKKLGAHKNSTTEWHNQLTTVNLKKKENIPNQENLGKVEQEKPKKSLRQATKNKSSISACSGGITLREGQKNGQKIDFKQEYYRKYSRLDNSSHSRSGYLTNRY